MAPPNFADVAKAAVEKEKMAEEKNVGEYIAGTSVGGLAQAMGTTLMIFRVMWLIVFIAGVAFTGYNLYVASIKFLSYPIQVTVSLSRNETLTFPGVTVCNLNPVKKSIVSCDDDFSSLTEIQDQYQMALVRHIKRLANSSTPLTHETVKKLLGDLSKGYDCPGKNNSAKLAAKLAKLATTTPPTQGTTQVVEIFGRKKRQASPPPDDYSTDDPYYYGPYYDPYPTDYPDAYADETTPSPDPSSNSDPTDYPDYYADETTPSPDPSANSDPTDYPDAYPDETTPSPDPSSNSDPTDYPDYYADETTPSPDPSANSDPTDYPDAYPDETTPSPDPSSNSDPTDYPDYYADETTPSPDPSANSDPTDYPDAYPDETTPSPDPSSNSDPTDYPDYYADETTPSPDPSANSVPTDYPDYYADETTPSPNLSANSDPTDYPDAYPDETTPSPDLSANSDLTDYPDAYPDETTQSLDPSSNSDPTDYPDYYADETTPIPDPSANSDPTDYPDVYADETTPSPDPSANSDRTDYPDVYADETTPSPDPSANSDPTEYPDYYADETTPSPDPSANSDPTDNPDAYGDEATASPDSYSYYDTSDYDDSYADNHSYYDPYADPDANTDETTASPGPSANADPTDNPDTYVNEATDPSDYDDTYPDSDSDPYYDPYADPDSSTGDAGESDPTAYPDSDDGAYPDYGSEDTNDGSDYPDSGYPEDGGYPDDESYSEDNETPASSDEYADGSGDTAYEGSSSTNTGGSGSGSGSGAPYYDEYNSGSGSAYGSGDGSGDYYTLPVGCTEFCDAFLGCYMDCSGQDGSGDASSYHSGSGSGVYSHCGEPAECFDPYCNDICTTESRAYLEEQAFNALIGTIGEEDKTNFAKFVQMSSTVDLQDVVELVQFTDVQWKRFGYTMEEMLLECSHDRKPCGVPNFKPTHSARYGNCMTFNSLYHEKESVRRTRKSGSRFGLRLTLNIKAPEYIGLLASEYGIRVSLHPPDVSPEPEDDGFIAEPGKLTSVAVRMREVLRLPLPYESACLDAVPEALAPFMRDKSVYTIRQCEKACRDFHLARACHCVDQAVPRPVNLTEFDSLANKTDYEDLIEAMNGEEDYEICDTFNAKQRKCKADVLSRETLPLSDESSTACDCRPQCDETNYKVTISSTDWPSDAYQQLKIINFVAEHKVADFFLKDLLARSKNDKEKDGTSGSGSGYYDGNYDTPGMDGFGMGDDYWDDFTLDYDWDDEPGWSKNVEQLHDVKTDIQKNLLRLHVYLESLTYEVIEESPEYPLSSLFADLGGIVGLYLGMSVCTVVEVVQLVAMLGLKCRNKKKVAAQDPAEVTPHVA